MARPTDRQIPTWYFLFSIFVFSINNLFAQATYQSVSTHVGSWDSNASWVGGTAPSANLNNDNIYITSLSRITRTGALSVNNNVLIDINLTGQITIEGDLEVRNGLTLNIEGRLIIDGELNIKNGGNIDLTGTGFLQVNGPVTLDQNAVFNIDGSVDFNDDVTLGQNASISLSALGWILPEI